MRSPKKQNEPPLYLTLRDIIRTEYGRYAPDERRKVYRTIAEYIGSDGEAYRKAFTHDSLHPTIPRAGLSAEITALLDQTN